MADTDIRIGEKRYSLVADDLAPTGKRAITRSFRATNVRDPARIRTASWKVWGKIGASLESISGELATDFTKNLETRHPGRLMSLGKRTAVSLSAVNPPALGATTPAFYGSAYYGTSYYGGTAATSGSGSSGGVVSGDIVRVLNEQQGYIFAGHGAIETMINPASWAVVQADVLPSLILDDVVWYNNGFLALGATTAVYVRTVNPATPAAFYSANLQMNSDDVYAKAFALGSDRVWFAGGLGATTAIAERNQLFYSLNLSTCSAQFKVGDASVNANGITAFGPWTFVGKDNGIFSFTDQGKPVPLSRALEGHRSANNGRRGVDPGWGWAYMITDVGLRALNGSADNPVGVGERMKQFTGHGGRPTAVWQERGELWVAYLTVAGDAYMYRCVFSDETQATGQPDMFPARFLTSTEIGAIFSTNITTNTSIVWGENGNIAYETISRDGRDDLFAARLYSITGGQWFGTTLDRDPHLLKTIRMAHCRVLNVEYCSDWQLAISFDLDPWDASPYYVDVGPLMDVAGEYDLIPASGDQPLTNISGRSFKPRLTQRAEGTHAETLPPEVNGYLEIEYDERPDVIEEVQCILATGTRTQAVLDELQEMMSENANGPVQVALPGGSVASPKWAMVADVQRRRDLKGDSVEGVEVTLHMWRTV